MTGSDRATHFAHLARRLATSLSRHPPSPPAERWALDFLTPAEVELWRAMTNVDRRHAVDVARRFATRRPGASRPEMAAALLHDAGKVQAGLGTIGRVVATVVGPRTATLRTYYDHEQIGARMAAAAGSDPVTVALIAGHGPAAEDLRAADDI